MDTDLLKTFLSVCKLQSVTKAASELSLTQPALTKRIKRLEDMVGTPLFDRVGNHLIETEAGRLLKRQSPAVLNSIDDMMQDIRDLSGVVSGQLNIATSHYIGMNRLPKHIDHFVKHYPKVDLNIDFIGSDKAYEKVLTGDIEIGLLTFPESLDQRLNHIDLWHESLHIVCHKDHPLASQVWDANALHDHACILPPNQTFPCQLFEHMLNDLGVQLGKVKTANYLEVIEKLIACNMGWGILPETLIKAPIIKLQHPQPLNHRTMGIIHRHNKSLSNAASAFIELLSS